jgi:hypothetical protein
VRTNTSVSSIMPLTMPRAGQRAHRRRVRIADRTQVRGGWAAIADIVICVSDPVRPDPASHIGRLLAKLDARDRAQLVIVGYEAGLVGPSGVPR